VTLGATELRPAVVDGQVVPRPLAPLFVRGDHRIVDAHDLGLFAGTLSRFLADPALMDAELASPPQPLAA
jgi:pyruvate/2-oxoglutarate dehydrogenase complex dihydrolipoamide acyltransferase (E2) component